TALPASLRRGDPLPETTTHAWRLTEAGQSGVDGLRRGGGPRRLAEALRAAPVAEDMLDDLVEGWRAAARSLAARGLAERIEAEPTHAAAAAPIAPGPVPNAEQATALEALRAAQGFAPVLLEGVTGSGKTEVYL